MALNCPVCHSAEGDPFLHVDASPVLCHRLCRSREEALAQPKGPIELILCPICGLVYNRAFDAGLIRYDGEYENALHFSGVFRDYEREMAERLARRYDLRGRTVVDIGCGDGHFLATLCRTSGALGLGFDPAFDDERHELPDDVALRIEPTLFEADSIDDVDPALACCRQVLEHIEQAASFVRQVRDALGAEGTPVFFEVPSAMHSIARRGFWDVIYEHVSYYTPAAIRVLFERAGFDVLDTAEAYSGQFLTVEARTTTEGRDCRADDAEIRRLHELTGAFGREFDGLRSKWRRWLAEIRAEGPRVVIWGAGSKTVTFLNSLAVGPNQVEGVVDRNPRKHGCFIVGTGHRIIAPADLPPLAPDEVLLLNPAYREEIGRELEEMDCAARVKVVA